MFSEKDRLNDFFGADILAGFGILPIYLVIENNLNQPLLIQQANIVLFNSEDKPIAQGSLSSAMAYINQKKYEIHHPPPATKLGVSVAYAIWWPSVFYSASESEKALAELSTVCLNLNNKALNDKIIYHGETHQGFAYFIFEDLNSIEDISILKIKVKNPITEENTTLEFKIDTTAIGNRIKEWKKM